MILLNLLLDIISSLNFNKDLPFLKYSTSLYSSNLEIITICPLEFWTTKIFPFSIGICFTNFPKSIGLIEIGNFISLYSRIFIFIFMLISSFVLILPDLNP